MKILIVGAGPVGKVYGRYLARGGAEISFFVKEKYLERSQGGYRFYNLKRNPGSEIPYTFKAYSTFSKLEELKAEKWDYVFLTFSSTALQGGWLAEFLAVAAPTTVVSLQPGMHDREILLRHLNPSDLITGTIPIIAYEAPLPGEEKDPGTAYWVPPGAKATFDGDLNRVAPLIELFEKAGVQTKAVKDTRLENAFPNAFLTVLIPTLREHNWSLSALSKPSVIEALSQSFREALAIQFVQAGMPDRSLWFTHFIPLRLLIKLAPKFTPFPLEAYLKIHFTKVSLQMEQALRDLIEAGKTKSLPTQKLIDLQRESETQK